MSDVKQRQVPNCGGGEEEEEEDGRPVVFSRTSIDMSRWHVARRWVKPDDEGGVGIDWDHLCREHGDELVPVKSSTAAATTTTMTLVEYRRDHWHRSDKPYLKDWHACLALKDTHPRLYELPPHFRDDWLNDWLAEKTKSSPVSTSTDGDYRFVYIGPAGSRTGVHTDVLHSNSWSAQLAGRKRWLLLHPSHAHLVENELGICNVTQFPDDVRALCVEIVQNPNETIFVPGGWYHSVDNLTDSLSVNHNWIDSASLERCWQHLLKEYRIAAHYIEDVRTMTTADEFAALVDRNGGCSTPRPPSLAGADRTPRLGSHSRCSAHSPAKLQSGMDKRSFIDMVHVVMNLKDDGDDDDALLQQRRRRHGQAFLRRHFDLDLDLDGDDELITL